MSARADVVLVTQFFPPETGAGARRAGALASALAARTRLAVRTLAPGYPDPALYEAGAAARSDAALAARVTRGPAFRPHERSFTRRAWLEIGMARALVRGVREAAPRVVVVSTPSMFLAPFAAWQARRCGARLVWDLRDLTWRYALESAQPSWPQRLVLHALEAVFVRLLRGADLVVAATPGIAAILAEQGVRADRIVTVTNGVTRAFLAAFGEAPRALPPRPRLTYVGLMGHNHDVRVLVDLARMLPEVDLHLVGDGPDRAAVEAHARANGVANVVFHGYVTGPEALAAHYRDSDVLVAHTRATPTLDRIVVPAKTFEYFATGRPVVYAGSGDTADRLRALDLARVVPPGDASALATAVRAALADPAGSAARAARARAWVAEHHVREARMDALVEDMVRRFGLDAAVV